MIVNVLKDLVKELLGSGHLDIQDKNDYKFVKVNPETSIWLITKSWITLNFRIYFRFLVKFIVCGKCQRRFTRAIVLIAGYFV